MTAAAGSACADCGCRQAEHESIGFARGRCRSCSGCSRFRPPAPVERSTEGRFSPVGETK